jgi:uncharacterized OsmC-like protein
MELAEIKLTLDQDYPIHADIDGTKLEIDGPESMGGKASMPNPTDWFIASVAACKIVYAMGFIKRRGLEVKSIKATADAAKGDGKCDGITVNLEIDGDIPENVRPALEKFIGKCFVGETVKQGCDVSYEVSY